METICLNYDLKMPSMSVATIGMFDGVHRGHQLLIGRVVDEAHRRGMASMVVTFDRSPRQVLDPSFHPQLLTTLDEKADAIAALGVDRLVVLPFSREMADLSAQAFMERVLWRQLNVAVLVTGYDNRFGHRTPVSLPNGESRPEGFDDYVRYGEAIGMAVLRGDVELMDDGSRAVSSSVIRELLAVEGQVELMPRWLTRSYQLRGRVTTGEHIGHRLGFPTANLVPDSPEKLIPAAGVYAVRATLAGERQSRPAMMNIGTRPTFEGRGLTLEVNILDFEGDIYGQSVCVTFVERLREERRFETPEALVEQLKKDRQRAMEVMGHKNEE